MPDMHSPYVGLSPFTALDEGLFFGRDAEAEIIATNLLSSPLTVLYGDSGVGKSSLLRAGVPAHLRRLEGDRSEVTVVF
jgi:Novel STAND NTPase 1